MGNGLNRFQVTILTPSVQYRWLVHCERANCMSVAFVIGPFAIIRHEEIAIMAYGSVRAVLEYSAV